MPSVSLQNIGEVLINRIAKKLKKSEPDSPEIKRALLLIGIRLESEAKKNIVNNTAVDTGRLLNSIKYEFFKTSSHVGIRVGSFGVPYAAMTEHGGEFTERQRRAMFASLRASGRYKKNYVSKGIISGGRYKARPFLRPAVKDNRRYIIEQLGRFL